MPGNSPSWFLLLRLSDTTNNPNWFLDWGFSLAAAPIFVNEAFQKYKAAHLRTNDWDNNILTLLQFVNEYSLPRTGRWYYIAEEGVSTRLIDDCFRLRDNHLSRRIHTKQWPKTNPKFSSLGVTVHTPISEPATPKAFQPTSSSQAVPQQAQNRAEQASSAREELLKEALKQTLKELTSVRACRHLHPSEPGPSQPSSSSQGQPGPSRSFSPMMTD